MRRRTRLFLIAVVAIAFGLCQTPLAWGATVVDWRRNGMGNNDGWDRGGMDGRWPDSSYYYVCQVRSSDGEVSFEVIDADDYKERLKELPQLYKEAYTQWKRDKREATKNKEKFAEKPPAKPLIRKVNTRKYKDEEDAKAYAEKLQKLWEEKMEKKRAKEEEVAAKKKAG